MTTMSRKSPEISWKHHIGQTGGSGTRRSGPGPRAFDHFEGVTAGVGDSAATAACNWTISVWIWLTAVVSAFTALRIAWVLVYAPVCRATPTVGPDRPSELLIMALAL